MVKSVVYTVNTGLCKDCGVVACLRDGYCAKCKPKHHQGGMS